MQNHCIIIALGLPELRVVREETEAVREASLDPFHALFPMLRYWRKEILNYFDHCYTNGVVEGQNNRIKSLPLSAAKGHQTYDQRLPQQP